MIHLKQPERSSLCGQTCIAMAAGVPIDEVVAHMKTKGGTRTKQLVEEFKRYGIHPKTDKLVKWDGVTRPPDFALMKMVFDDHPSRKTNPSHWVLNWEGVVHDPECAIEGVHCPGRFTSYLELTKPVTGPYTIGQYADYAAHVWSNAGKYYDMLNPEHRALAASDSDDFVREMAKHYT